MILHTREIRRIETLVVAEARDLDRVELTLRRVIEQLDCLPSKRAKRIGVEAEADWNRRRFSRSRLPLRQRKCRCGGGAEESAALHQLHRNAARGPRPCSAV